jgi:hypothetical protein
MWSLLLFLACGPNFHTIQQEDTIEAYQRYLDAEPEGRWVPEATKRIETLRYEAVVEENTLAGFDRFLEEHPDSNYFGKVMSLREHFVYTNTKNTHTVEAYQAYLKEYPTRKKHSDYAKNQIVILEYGEGLTLTDPRMAEVNMAENPKGPMNGWGFEVDVENKGKKRLKTVNIEVSYLGEDGSTVGSDTYYLVHYYWQLPVPEIMKTPMKPREKRTWEWTKKKDYMPEDWAEGKFELKVIKIIFAK